MLIVSLVEVYVKKAGSALTKIPQTYPLNDIFGLVSYVLGVGSGSEVK